MLIDMHVHIYPENIASKVTEALSSHYGITVPYKGILSEYKSIAQKGNVDTAVFFTAATKADQVPAANLWAMKNNSKTTIAFGTLHPDYPYIDEVIKQLKKANIKGIKFHPDFQHFYLDDEKALQMYEKLAKDFLLIFHVGDDVVPEKTNYTSPERMARVLDLIPNLKVIAAHMGGYQMWERSFNCLVGKKVYFDTSSAINIMPEDLFIRMIHEHGPQQILLGSDYPYNDPITEASYLRKMPLKSHEYEAIVHHNAQKLLSSLGL